MVAFPSKSNRRCILEDEPVETREEIPASSRVTGEEARKILAQYGPITRCERLSRAAPGRAGLPPSVIVDFAEFDPSQELQATRNRIILLSLTCRRLHDKRRNTE